MYVYIYIYTAPWKATMAWCSRWRSPPTAAGCSRAPPTTSISVSISTIKNSN